MSRITRLSIVERMPEYNGMKFKESDLSPDVAKTPDVMYSGDELTKLVFAPDPVAGVPNSALSIMLSKDRAPEIAAYIQENLLRVQASYATPTTDADMALVGVKSRQETFTEYAERLREFATKKDD